MGVDFRLPLAADSLTSLATCACCAFFFDVEVLVGGGVCMELADLILDPSSFSITVSCGVVLPVDTRLSVWFVEVAEGLGDELSCRDGSTGGRGNRELGDRWCTWDKISVSMSCPGKGLLRPRLKIGLCNATDEATCFGVLRKSGLAASVSAGLKRGS